MLRVKRAISNREEFSVIGDPIKEVSASDSTAFQLTIRMENPFRAFLYLLTA